MGTPTLERFNHFLALGSAGAPAGVDFLMAALVAQDDFATSRLVDYALSQVETRAGRERLVHYLFHGSPQQRNYAALYFKRRGRVDLLDEAVAQGKIDTLQAYAR
jgi:hypothetical protein